MHTTCIDQHWSSSGVSKIADEMASDVDEILKFKHFKLFKMKVACNTTNKE
jgi:hypothetical protein